ncbi:hypothetical protein ACWD26_07990 [Streptomyces sp. NPDC002787]
MLSGAAEVADLFSGQIKGLQVGAQGHDDDRRAGRRGQLLLGEEEQLLGWRSRLVRGRAVQRRPVRRAVRSRAVSTRAAMTARSWHSGTRGMADSPGSSGRKGTAGSAAGLPSLPRTAAGMRERGGAAGE